MKSKETKKRKLYSLMQLFEYITVLSIFAVVTMYVFYRPVIVSQYAIYSDKDRNEAIKSVIVWETDYSEKIENLIVFNLNSLPENILNGWLATDCSIVVCPNIKGYLDMNDDFELPDNAHTMAYNLIKMKDNRVISSDIYILGSGRIINKSLLHEIGHYVYHNSTDTETKYILPNYETNSNSFVENECDNVLYYLDEEEYFAEVFAYTVIHGVNDEYPDTKVMKNIIDNF